MLLKTLSPSNKFRFACPVFGAEVEIAGCLSLRDQYACGKQPPARKGCQACLSASKCPMIRLLQDVRRTGDDPGYHNTDGALGRLKPELLEHIGPIVVHEPLLDRYGVPESERALIIEANERVHDRNGKRTAPAPIKLDALPSAKAEPADETLVAAMTGDMSAAITKAVEAEKSPKKATSGLKPAEAQSHAKVAPTPPAAKSEPSDKRDLAISTNEAPPTGKKPSLLELARQRRAAAA